MKPYVLPSNYVRCARVFLDALFMEWSKSPTFIKEAIPMSTWDTPDPSDPDAYLEVMLRNGEIEWFKRTGVGSDAKFIRLGPCPFSKPIEFFEPRAALTVLDKTWTQVEFKIWAKTHGDPYLITLLNAWGALNVRGSAYYIEAQLNNGLVVWYERRALIEGADMFVAVGVAEHPLFPAVHGAWAAVKMGLAKGSPPVEAENVNAPKINLADMGHAEIKTIAHILNYKVPPDAPASVSAEFPAGLTQLSDFISDKEFDVFLRSTGNRQKYYLVSAWIGSAGDPRYWLEVRDAEGKVHRLMRNTAAAAECYLYICSVPTNCMGTPLYLVKLQNDNVSSSETSLQDEPTLHMLRNAAEKSPEVAKASNSHFPPDLKRVDEPRFTAIKRAAVGLLEAFGHETESNATMDIFEGHTPKSNEVFVEVKDGGSHLQFRLSLDFLGIGDASVASQPVSYSRFPTRGLIRMGDRDLDQAFGSLKQHPQFHTLAKEPLAGWRKENDVTQYIEVRTGDGVIHQFRHHPFAGPGTPTFVHLGPVLNLHTQS